MPALCCSRRCSLHRRRAMSSSTSWFAGLRHRSCRGGVSTAVVWSGHRRGLPRPPPLLGSISPPLTLCAAGIPGLGYPLPVHVERVWASAFSSSSWGGRPPWRSCRRHCWHSRGRSPWSSLAFSSSSSLGRSHRHRCCRLRSRRRRRYPSLWGLRSLIGSFQVVSWVEEREMGENGPRQML